MRQRIYAAFGLACLCLALFIGALQINLPVGAQSGVSNFDTVQASGDVIVGDDVTTGDDVTVGDDLAVGDDATIAGYLRYTPQTTVTVVYQGVITPTGSLVYITAAAARGTRLVLTTTATTGDVIRVVNVGAQTITLTDTAPLVMEGNFAMGAKDNITFYHDGDEWIELARANN